MIILYVFKIITGIVPNIENDKFQVKVTQNARLGRKCIIPSINTVSPASVASMVELSFPVQEIPSECPRTTVYAWLPATSPQQFNY